MRRKGRTEGGDEANVLPGEDEGNVGAQAEERIVFLRLFRGRDLAQGKSMREDIFSVYKVKNACLAIFSIAPFA